MRLSDCGVNSPGRLGVAIDRAFDTPSGLIEVGGRTLELERFSLLCFRFEDLQLYLGKMQIAVVATAWATHGQRVMRTHIEPQCRYAIEMRGCRDRVRVLVWFVAAGQYDSIRTSRQRSSFG